MNADRSENVKAPLTKDSGERSFPLYPIDPWESANIRGSPAEHRPRRYDPISPSRSASFT